MSPRLKTYLLNALKLSVAFALVYWMVHTGKLDFSQLEVVFGRPDRLVLSIGYWALCFVCLASLRWFVLLRGIGLAVPYARTLYLHLIGLFFNSTMPGAVGGDIIKAVYVMRDNDSTTKTPALLTILLDRVVGLMGLFILGVVAVSLNLQNFWVKPEMRPIVVSMYTLLGVTIGFYTLVFIPMTDENDPFLKLFSKNVPGFSIIKSIYVALRSYRKQPMALVYALLLSIVIQSLNMSYFIFLTEILNQAPVNVLEFASIFPIGVFTTALPLAPGGLGVGHLAFDKLFEFIGLQHGANVFNIFLLLSVTLNLTGIVPYLFIRKKAAPLPSSTSTSALVSPR